MTWYDIRTQVEARLREQNLDDSVEVLRMKVTSKDLKIRPIETNIEVEVLYEDPRSAVVSIQN